MLPNLAASIARTILNQYIDDPAMSKILNPVLE